MWAWVPYKTPLLYCSEIRSVMWSFERSWYQKKSKNNNNNSILDGKWRQYLYLSSSTKKATFIRFWLSAENTRRGNYFDIARVFLTYHLHIYCRYRRKKRAIPLRTRIHLFKCTSSLVQMHLKNIGTLLDMFVSSSRASYNVLSWTRTFRLSFVICHLLL